MTITLQELSKEEKEKYSKIAEAYRNEEDGYVRIMQKGQMALAELSFFNANLPKDLLEMQKKYNISLRESYVKDLEIAINSITKASQSMLKKLGEARPSTPNGMYTCLRCDIRSVYFRDTPGQHDTKDANIEAHCELCEHSGTIEDIVSPTEIAKILSQDIMKLTVLQ